MNNAYKPWTKEMDKELARLLSLGVESQAIAYKMGRSELSISQRTMLLHNRGILSIHPV